MRTWKRNFDWNDDGRLSIREGLIALLLGVVVGGGLAGGWLVLWRLW